ncbi:PIG-L deacetylase family protein [Paenibacillus sacheonensis]|uniref:PIG-L family deacetylase n=1 Tax=Paenibacillus sacheonensis TaxID=742054 RepID=A0A7X4YMI7_9BACL|nr:PIG-L deacetylase family protein [Paenibacillus sacheonensis]MBM7563273.1 LmbE family N-acetylglucosaminyl deacetylase [Paenibacillus sacheonensis]NBC68169.1 PIG-L family deacetylase [Paenibacillus sacheonensis]
MRILAIGAHPDDIEILCGGTLAKYAARGDRVTLMIATNGNVGSATLTREEIAAVRKREAERSAAVIGAELIWMDFDDEFLFHDRPTRMAFINAIRRANPDIMFVHGPNDYHPDHRICGEIAADCRIPVTVPLIETEYPPMDKVPHVFLMDNIGGVGFEPEAYVDVSDTMDVRNQMLKCHASQDAWLQYVYGIDCIEFSSKLPVMRGMAIGAAYAEAFRSLPMYPVSGGPHLLP